MTKQPAEPAERFRANGHRFASGKRVKIDDAAAVLIQSQPVSLVRLTEGDQVAAGFFFGLAVFGSATGSDPRSIEVSRPAVKV